MTSVLLNMGNQPGKDSPSAEPPISGKPETSPKDDRFSTAAPQASHIAANRVDQEEEAFSPVDAVP